MKKLFLILCVFISVKTFGAIDTNIVKSKISDVTVFFNGAQVTRTAEIKLKKGKHLLIFDELPQEINPASIQIAAIEKCKILSVKHQFKGNNMSEKDQKVLDLEAKVKQFENKIKEIKNKSRAFDLEEKLLLDNSRLNRDNKGSNVKEIKEAADYYRVRLNEIMQGRLLLFSEVEDINKQLQETYKSLNELVSKKLKTYSQIYVAIECESDVSNNIKASYYISSAAWTPSYDFRVDDITKPLVIVYNADVFQTSGENWENVNITLSTNNPSLSGNKPELVAWQVGTNPYQSNNVQKSVSSNLKGKVTEPDNYTSIPYANVVLMKGDQIITGTTTDVDGQYIFKSIPSGLYTLKVSFIGYKGYEIQNLNIQPNMENYHNVVLYANSQNLQEVVVSSNITQIIDKGYTVATDDIKKIPARSAQGMATSVNGFTYDWSDDTQSKFDYMENNSSYERKQKVSTTDYISNSMKSGVTNLEYAIEIPYSIPSDGQNYSIKIKESSLPVIYLYHAVPKLETDVFLSAEITEWNVLNLLSGKINIYYQGTYTGESFIDANNASDTLSVSLGRDKGILIQREGNKEKFDKKTIGSNIKETIAWDITVKNNKDAKIKIIIEDQYPLSYRKTVEVLLMEALNAKIDEKTGKLIWELELNPGDKKVMNFIYSVKYPKYTNLLVE